MKHNLPIPEQTETVARQVVDAASNVYRGLGPGLVDAVYEACLWHEFNRRLLPFRSRVTLPVVYDSVRIDAGVCLSLLVDECVVVDVKAVEEVTPLHDAQLLTYLKLTGHRLGLLINFNVPAFDEAVKRIVL